MFYARVEVLDAMGDDEAVEELFKTDPLQEGLLQEEEPEKIPQSRWDYWQAWCEMFETQSRWLENLMAGMVAVNFL